MYNLKKMVKIEYLDENSIVLDIETNGVSRLHSQVYVIGLIKNGTFFQFAIENENEEKKLLTEIFKFLDNKHIITFNGQNFDLPFLKARYQFYGLTPFEEKSQFDIYRYFILNKLITDYQQFSLQEIEKINQIERHENFEVDDDVKFYNKIKSIDISKVLIHNKYDVINTAKLLKFVTQLEEIKKFSININNEKIILKFINLNIEKDFLIINLKTKNNFMNYAFENQNYSLDWNKNELKIKIKIIEGFISDNIKGYVYVNLINKIIDESNYNLPNEFIVLFDKKYYINNIKNIIINIIEFEINK